MINVGDYVWSNKGRNGETGGRVIGLTTWKNYDAAKVRKADKSVRVFLEQNLTKISRRTFGRRTGVNSLPLR